MILYINDGKLRVSATFVWRFYCFLLLLSRDPYEEDYYIQVVKVDGLANGEGELQYEPV